METEQFFCAQAADEREDPIAGTAPRGSYWILIEYRGSWPVNGFDGLDLDPQVHAAVFAAAHARRARILLIRRHGRRRRGGPGRWAVLHRATGDRLMQHWGTWREERDLLDIVRVLNDPADLTPRGTPEPVVLVCAHGLHDVCCAVRGRPVAGALSARWPHLVWECTHVGGDRFAANILLVPDGVYYGRLDAESAVDVVAGHLDDRIDARHLRGYTDLVPVEQVAVAAALETQGPAGRDDYAIVSTSREDDRWTVHVASRVPGRDALAIDIEVTRSPPRQLTCRGTARASAFVYSVVAVRQAPKP
ncbi:sucrase ferredoxin [Aeromicrobium sp. PE09-221]|nr:sucrase ferredoxin [Aeromicrobium sp. PE09-221]